MSARACRIFSNNHIQPRSHALVLAKHWINFSVHSFLSLCRIFHYSPLTLGISFHKVACLEPGQCPNRFGRLHRSFQSVPDIQKNKAQDRTVCTAGQSKNKASSQKMSGVSRISVCKFTSHLQTQVLCKCYGGEAP